MEFVGLFKAWYEAEDGITFSVMFKAKDIREALETAKNKALEFNAKLKSVDWCYSNVPK
ncbi:MAG: hypothetical protein ACPLVJ_02020 [Candidatus Bathyarchaeales archaeon]